MLCVFACHTIVIYPEVVCIPAEVYYANFTGSIDQNIQNWATL